MRSDYGEEVNDGNLYGEKKHSISSQLIEFAIIEFAVLTARAQASELLPGFGNPERPTLSAETMSRAYDAYNWTAAVVKKIEERKKLCVREESETYAIADGEQSACLKSREIM